MFTTNSMTEYLETERERKSLVVRKTPEFVMKSMIISLTLCRQQLKKQMKDDLRYLISMHQIESREEEKRRISNPITAVNDESFVRTVSGLCSRK